MNHLSPSDIPPSDIPPHDLRRIVLRYALPGALLLLAACAARTAPAIARLTRQPYPTGALVTTPAHEHTWHTRYVDIIGTDTDAVIDHGAVRADMVVRPMLVISHSTNSIRIEMRGCCGNDWFRCDRAVLGPGDTAHMDIGWEISHVTSPFRKITTVIFSPSQAGDVYGDKQDQHFITTRLVRLRDVAIVPNSLLTITPPEPGRAASATLTVIATSLAPIDVRATIIAGSGADYGFRLNDTALHHLRPGDSLHLQVIAVPRSGADTVRRYDGYSHVFIRTSASEIPIASVPVYVTQARR